MKCLVNYHKMENCEEDIEIYGIDIPRSNERKMRSIDGDFQLPHIISHHGYICTCFSSLMNAYVSSVDIMVEKGLAIARSGSLCVAS